MGPLAFRRLICWNAAVSSLLLLMVSMLIRSLRRMSTMLVMRMLTAGRHSIAVLRMTFAATCHVSR